MESIQYRLDQFEGPLDLLLTLIEKNKINIDDIPIALLCEQYMAYIRANLSMNMEVASEFLYMASELMLIKSRMLLPRDPETEEDPRAALRDTVLEYQRAKLAASELSELFTQYGDRMIKEPDDISPDRTYVADHTLEVLRTALIHAMTESNTVRDAGGDVFSPILHQSYIPVQAMTISLLDRLQSGEVVFMDSYFRDSRSRSEMIAKFLSLLELFKTQIVSLSPEEWENSANDGSGVLEVSCHLPLLLVHMPEAEQLAALTEYV